MQKVGGWLRFCPHAFLGSLVFVASEGCERGSTHESLPMTQPIVENRTNQVATRLWESWKRKRETLHALDKDEGDASVQSLKVLLEETNETERVAFVKSVVDDRLTSMTDANFDSFATIACLFYLVETGKREMVVSLLAGRPISRVGVHTRIEYYLEVLAAPTLKDGIEVLFDAYHAARQEKRPVLEEAITRGFAWLQFAEKGAALVERCEQWYLTNKHRIQPNIKYGLIDIDPILNQMEGEIGLFVDQGQAP